MPLSPRHSAPLTDEYSPAGEVLLLQQQRSFRILSSMADGFMLLDHAFRVQQINAAALRIDGRAASELLGRTVWELWPGSEQLAMADHYRYSIRHMVSVDFEQAYTRSGQTFWFDMQAHPSADGLAVFYRDISARKNKERDLIEQEALLRLAIDSADVGEWDVDMASQEMFWPARVKAMFGISADAPATLDDYYQGVHPDDRERTLASFRDTADPLVRSQYDAEYRTVGKEDKVIRWVAARGRGLFSEAGVCTRVIGTAIDITQRKQTEEALRQSEERLRLTDRRKDEFLAMLAHELRNPLAPISAAAQLLQLGTADQHQVRRTSEIITRQVNHMTSLVDDLLDVSRVTSGLVQLRTERVEVAALVADAVEQTTPLIRARGHDLELSLCPDCALVQGDRKRLVQTLVNILNNAAKYTPEGGKIRLRTEVQGAQVRIEVSDNGLGMTPELVSRAFNLFAQAERSSDRSLGGLGLGLALVKSLIELHHGTVSCKSAGLGQGSTFTICLPQLVEQQAPAAALQPAAGSTAQQAPALRVMVVDDNVDAAAMLALLLEASGHQVVVEHDARRALVRAQQDAPQVCLLDIGLPDIDGNELARQLRAHPATRAAMLIAVTGYGQAKDREQSMAAGFDAHLVKPVDIARLATMLETIVPA